MNIKIEEENGIVVCKTPYHPNFPSKARKLGGKWDSSHKVWTFDCRDKERVQELCREIFGTDGNGDKQDLVTLKVTAESNWYECCNSLFLAGRQIARAYGRDSGAKLGDGVVVIKGGFCSSGSRKNWATECKEGTVFELRDVPRSAVEKISEPGLKIEVLGEKSELEILEEKAGTLRKELAETESKIELLKNK